MISQSTRPRVTAAAAAVAIAVGTFAAAGDAGAAMPPTAQPIVVTVASTGDPATVADLTPVATVGATTVITTTSAMIGVASGPGGTENYDITSTDVQRATVRSAAPDGGATVEFVVEESTVTTNSGDVMAEQAYTVDLDVLQALPLKIDLDAHDAQTAIRPAAGTAPTVEQSAAIATYSALGETGPFVAPADPVGIGATWTATLRFAASWCDLPLSYSYRLASVTEERYVIEYTWSANVSPVTTTADGAADLEGITITATINGSGTVEETFTGSSSVVRSQGHYRFVYNNGHAEVVDEYDIWTESIATSN